MNRNLMLVLSTVVFMVSVVVSHRQHSLERNQHQDDVVRMTQSQTALTDSKANIVTDSLHFLAIGDWGGLPYSPFSTMIQKAIGKRLGEIAEEKQYKFVLGLGDNFYYDGVQSADDPRFQETFENVFTANSLHIPWYMMAGNHDHHSSVKAQIDYTKRSNRWMFPDYNYTFVRNLPWGSVRFVVIDTVVLCGVSDLHYSGQQPQGATDRIWALHMLSWVKEVLQNSRDDYLFVCGHYPVYSIAHHGPTKCLLDSLEPLLHKYNVTAYLNGHDHNLQHIHYEDDAYRTAVDYFTIGAGNFISTSRAHRHSVPRGAAKFYWADPMSFGGIADVELGPAEGVLSFIQANGTVLYKHVLHPRRQSN